MSQAQIEAKFFDCARLAVSEEVAESILAALNTLPGGLLGDLWPLLGRA